MKGRTRYVLEIEGGWRRKIEIKDEGKRWGIWHDMLKVIHRNLYEHYNI